MEPNLAVHDISVLTIPSVDNKGKLVNTKRVTFQVGDHGPFHFEDVEAVLTTDEIKKRIAAQVDEVRQLEALQGNIATM